MFTIFYPGIYNFLSKPSYMHTYIHTYKIQKRKERKKEIKEDNTRQMKP